MKETPPDPKLARLARLIAPPPRLKVSDWAEEYAHVPSDDSAEGGKYHGARMPWQPDMLDDVLDPTVTEIAWMIASQLGKTLCIVFIVMYFIHQRPRKMLVVYPKIDDAKDWMRDKFVSACNASDCMEGLLKDPRKRDSGSRTLNRKFPGGALIAVGSISTSSLRRVSAGGIIQDEIDDYETTNQGDPMLQADNRARNFHDAFKLKSSTPTNKGFSRIESKYDASDKEKFFIPCPCCGHMHTLELANFKFSFTPEELERLKFPDFNPRNFKWKRGECEHRDTARAMFVCPSCERGISDQDRMAAIYSRHKSNPPIIVDGKEYRAAWIKTRPLGEDGLPPKIRGRHLNGFYCLIGLKKEAFGNYLHQFAEEFLAAKAGGIETFRVWVNTFLSETFEEASEKLDWEPIQKRAEDYCTENTVPIEVMFIIAGMDVHPDRVEIATYGWGSKQTVWAIEYVVLYGDFDMPEMQDRVEDYLLNRRWQHDVLGAMDIRACGIDSGHQTKVKAVYHFSKKHFTRNFWAVKGVDEPLGSLYTATVEKRLRLTRFNLNTGHLKSYIYDRLRNENPTANYIHFPRGEVIKEVKADELDEASALALKLYKVALDDKSRKKVIEEHPVIKGLLHPTYYTGRFYTQLCSERRYPERQKNGSVIYHWKKLTTAMRNEALDTMVYAFGVYEIVKRQDWIERQWIEVCKVLAEREKGIVHPALEQPKPKTYQIKPANEAKLPELKTEPQRAQRSQKPGRRGPPGRGGFFNPLGL